ncbi:MAG: peptide MFS transporter [Phycisphaerales bacterium]|nr:peptide MFS transporter [Phycisphaerales bacterium]
MATTQQTPALVDTRPQFLGHPAGLFLLFMVEMWERFSYYGMRALLVLYLTSPTSGMRKPPAGAMDGFNPGPGWADADASKLYGWYTGLAYLLPVIGGIIADKLIGTHRSMLVGGVLIMAGHIALAVSGLGTLATSAMGMSVFVFGLALIVLGTGHFKPSVSVMVGQLYPEGDPRRDGAFSIFYMGINMGAFLCAFVCGTLGEKVGWHWGFGSAAVGMFLGLAMYMIGKPLFLRGIGDGPKDVANFSPLFLVSGLGLSAGFAMLFHIGALRGFETLLSPAVVITLGVLVLGLATWFVAIQRPIDRGPVASIFIFMMFNAFFWLAFEQAGSSMTLFTDRYTDAKIGSWNVPTTWFQSVNPAIIFIFAPLFAALWTGLGRRRMNPSQPLKISMGLILLGIGFVVLVMGARTIQVGPGGPEDVIRKAAIWFILGAYFFHTMGELCLSPTGLSYVTKAAPVRFVSLLMGIWFISSFIANLSGGLIAAQTERLEKGEIKLPWNLGQGTGSVQADFFTLFVVTSIGAGILILVLTPILKKLMRHPDD